MYEYTPEQKKTREWLTALLLTGIAFAFYFVSRIEKIPYPALFQLVAVFFLVGAVMVVTRFAMRRFTYRIEQTEQGIDDFVILEHYGKKTTTVCRISVSQIQSVVRPNKENKRELAEKMKGKRVYQNTAEFFAPDLCILEATDDGSIGDRLFIKFCADEILYQRLLSEKDHGCL